MSCVTGLQWLHVYPVCVGLCCVSMRSLYVVTFVRAFVECSSWPHTAVQSACYCASHSRSFHSTLELVCLCLFLSLVSFCRAVHFRQLL